MAVTVKFGSAAATNVVVVNDTTITCKSPVVAAGVQDVVVTTAGGTATKTGGWTSVPTPTITGNLTPATGPEAGGTDVTIKGTGFKEGN